MMWMIYLIGSIDGFLGMFVVGAIACLATAGMISLLIANGDIQERWPVVKKLMVAAAIFIVIFVVTPNSKTIAAMYLLPKIASNEHVKAIPDKALTALEKKLDGYIESIGDKSEK